MLGQPKLEATIYGCFDLPNSRQPNGLVIIQPRVARSATRGELPPLFSYSERVASVGEMPAGSLFTLS